MINFRAIWCSIFEYEWSISSVVLAAFTLWWMFFTSLDWLLTNNWYWFAFLFNNDDWLFANNWYWFAFLFNNEDWLFANNWLRFFANNWYWFAFLFNNDDWLFANNWCRFALLFNNDDWLFANNWLRFFANNWYWFAFLFNNDDWLGTDNWLWFYANNFWLFAYDWFNLLFTSFGHDNDLFGWFLAVSGTLFTVSRTFLAKFLTFILTFFFPTFIHTFQLNMLYDLNNFIFMPWIWFITMFFTVFLAYNFSRFCRLTIILITSDLYKKYNLHSQSWQQRTLIGNLKRGKETFLPFDLIIYIM